MGKREQAIEELEKNPEGLKMEDLFGGMPQDGGPIDESTLNPETNPAEDKKDGESEGEEEQEDEKSTKVEPENEAKREEPEEKGENHAERRWRTMMLRQKQKDQEIADLKASLAQIQQNISQMSPSEQVNAIAQLPEEFVQLFGENEEAWAPMEKLIRSLARKEAEELDKARKEAEAAERKELAEAEAHLEEALESLSEEVGVELTGKSKESKDFLKFVDKYPILGEDGDIDLRKTYELFAERRPQKTVSASKKMAAEISGEKSESSNTVAIPKLGELKNKTWRDYLPN